jgi:GDPmannose 4,6-dehydratase
MPFLTRALITGISGQDGSYLAELLLELGAEVHGLVRPGALTEPGLKIPRILHLLERVRLHEALIEDEESVLRVMETVSPCECYHLAGCSYVGDSAEDELAAIRVNTLGAYNVISSLFRANPGARFFFAGSSEMYGDAVQTPQTETTPPNPRSPYGISKTWGYFQTKYLREKRGFHASTGVLYNHESPRRGANFVTRKITSHAAQIKLGLKDRLVLGNTDARRDWGHSREYVRAMVMMTARDAPDDYIVATGESHSVKECLEIAFDQCGLDPYRYLEVDKRLERFDDSALLVGNPDKIRRRLGWSNGIPFDSMIREMVKHDLETYASAAAAATREKPRVGS